jgi:uncharacterized protein YcbK (DUF882 family)
MAAYRRYREVRLSKHFTSLEFDCKGHKCCAMTLIDSLLITHLERIRNHFNAPVIINSGYRCAPHNRRVGGARSSRHLQGQAADIVVKGVKPREVAKYAESIGVKGIGLYDTFVHIDTRSSKSFWRGHQQDKVNSFR